MNEHKRIGKAVVRILDPAEAEERYHFLLAEVSDIEKFKEDGENYELTVSDTAIYDEICDLEFLLDL